MTPDAQDPALEATRRRFLAVSAAAGLAGTLFPGALLALAAQPAGAQSPSTSDAMHQPVKFKPITAEMIDQAASLSGLSFTEEQHKLMIDGLTSLRNGIETVWKLDLPNSIAPCLVFDPVPAGTGLDTERRPIKLGPAPHIVVEVDSTSETAAESLAFLTVRELAELLRTRKVTSTALAKMYLARLKRYDPLLHFVITLTEDRAMKQAAVADSEIAVGKYRGPLHGMPWGAKDLLAVKGYPTTWGAGPYMDQSFDDDAEVVKRLDAAGAVLLAKLTLGALAQGDLWGSEARLARTQSLESAPRFERQLGRKRQRGLCRLRRFCHRDGDAGFDLFA